jgi:hypothetical protein
MLPHLVVLSTVYVISDSRFFESMVNSVLKSACGKNFANGTFFTCLGLTTDSRKNP